jgi:transposase
MEQTKYSAEFKEDAIRLSERETPTKAAERLGILVKYIYLWRRNKRLKKSKPIKGLKEGETLEQGFARLEKEMAELAEANYILRKAMGFLAGR